MYSALGSSVAYKGRSYRVAGCSPASKVSAGNGFAVLLIGIGWVNTDSLDKGL